MIELRDLQRRCYDAFVRGDTQALLPFVLTDHIAADARIQVYQNNAREAFTKTLGSSYPVIAALVGEDCFHTLAQDYLRRHPSASGDLGEFGNEFSVLLDAHYDGSAFEYLADVARLEWLCEQVRSAADARPADLAQLQLSAGEGFGALRFALHPAARLMSSRFPVFSIWRANTLGDDTQLDLAQGREDVLVLRGDNSSGNDPGDIELHRIDAVSHAVLQRLDTGATLLEALSESMSDSLSESTSDTQTHGAANVESSPDRLCDEATPPDALEVLRQIALLRVLVERPDQASRLSS